jgi:hypothetical protein
MAIEGPGVRATLVDYGLLKFFECPLIQAQEYLLQFLIQMWSFLDWAPIPRNAPIDRAGAA